MAGAGKKTFTAGETLTASDVNTYLMEQSVMYFGGTAARASAIPTPSTGMTSYIGVTGTATIPQIETYTGSAWQTPYGMTLLGTATLSGASFTVANVFSAAYDTYHLVISNVRTNSSAAGILLQMGTTGGSGYRFVNFHAAYGSTVSTSINVDSSNGTSAYTTGIITATDNFSGGTIEVNNPFLAADTMFHSNGVDPRVAAAAGSGPRMGSGWLDDTTSYTGFTLSPSGGVTFNGGTVRVYGLRNS
jgi:hypothetical protein